MGLNKVWFARGMITGTVIIFLIGAFEAGLQTGKTKAAETFLNSVEITKQEIATERNKNISLQKLLQEAQENEEGLLQVIASLKAKPPEIRYVIETETVLKPAEPIYVSPNLPRAYLFKLHDDLVVASFRKLPSNEYELKTYELLIHGNVVVAEDETSVSIQVESGFDPGKLHEVPVNIDVSRVQEPVTKVLEPHVGMGVTFSAPSLEPSVSLYSSFIHPNRNLDLLGIRASGNTNTFSVGLDPVSYNIATHLPVFTDLWVQPGLSLNNRLETNLDLTLATKF